MNIWLILFIPLIASLLITFITRGNPKLSGFVALAGLLTSFGMALPFAMSAYSAYAAGNISTFESSVSWIAIPGLSLEFGFLVNPLSLVMILLVLIVSGAVFYYSIEYMEDDPGFSRYFACLSFFVFSMLGIVLSNNFLQLFIFWELVGASSYFLIGFWYEKDSAADAGKKAFLTNRVGDFGFLIGILLLWTLAIQLGEGTLNFLKLETMFSVSAATHFYPASGMGVISLLIFCGVIGKSAQFPLHVWLPDAMEGPTPVSALIHAATMVAAGVYLLARTFFLFHYSAPFALEMIAYLGGFTAIFAATQALVQTDIKRILAYSTLSQLGYMVMAVGLGGSGIAMYHLTTHAFFKALLFLGAGSVIHMTHEQDLAKLGKLLSAMPITGITLIVGALCLSGIWPTSGFWSKDEILTLAYEQNLFLFWIGILTAFLTAFYTTRLVILAFFGKKAAATHAGHKPKDPKHWMLVPLILLAGFSLLSSNFGLEKLLRNHLDHHTEFNMFVAGISSLFALSGIFLGVFIYQWNLKLAATLQKKFDWIYQVLIGRYFIDQFYDWILENIQRPFSEMCERFEHQVVVDGMVNGTARVTAAFGNIARKLQTGRIQTYTTVFLGGVVFILYWFLIRGNF